MDPWTKWSWWQRWELCVGIRQGVQHTKADLATSVSWAPDLPTAETNAESQIWHHFLRWPASYLVVGWPCWTISSREKTTLCSYWSILILVKILSFLDVMFCWNQHPWAYRMPYPPSWHSTQSCFWKRNSLHIQRSVTVGPQLWNPLALPCSSWFGKMKWPFEDTVTAPIRWQQHAGLG